MTRTALLSAAALTCVMGAGQVSAQSLSDIVKDSEGGRMPTRAEWQQRPPAGGDPSTRAPAPDGVPSTAGAPPAACTPPGMPALDDLISVGHQTLIAPVEGTEETVAVTAVGLVRRDHLARYRLGEVPLDFITYFVRGHLAAVDDHPGDPSEPDLVDSGMVSRRGAALAQGTPLCQWERLPRARRGEERASTPAAQKGLCLAWGRAPSRGGGPGILGALGIRPRSPVPHPLRPGLAGLPGPREEGRRA
jgi:hypothetical protein